MKCQNCNKTVTRSTKFCPNCGKKIVPRTSANVENTGRQFNLLYGITMIMGGILIGALLLEYGAGSGENGLTEGSMQLQQSPMVLDIAQEFTCFCGQCNDPLATCDCSHPDGALEVKRFIAQKLSEGHQKPHIIEMIKTRYGVTNGQKLPLPMQDSLLID